MVFPVGTGIHQSHFFAPFWPCRGGIKPGDTIGVRKVTPARSFQNFPGAGFSNLKASSRHSNMRLLHECVVVLIFVEIN